VYGNDADQTLLALATHEPHCSIIHPTPFDDTRGEYQMLHMAALREYIAIDMRPGDNDERSLTCRDTPANGERRIDDFILLTLFLGSCSHSATCPSWRCVLLCFRFAVA